MENRVHSELKAALSAMPDMIITIDNLKQIRDIFASMPSPALADSIQMTERLIPGFNGAPDVSVIIFEPIEKTSDNLPGILFMHGGAFVIGNANNVFCQTLIDEINCVVVSVEYRLAPENPYPAALEDCYSALKWLSENAFELGVDSSNIAVVGGSAGGGLTAALTLFSRDHKGPSIAFQMPLYPMIDDRGTPSSKEIIDKRVWNGISNANAWKMYLGSNPKNKVSQYAAPARANDLSGLPPTYTCVGECDPFRDETIDYVARLTQAGVPVEFHLYPGCFHLCESLVPQAEVSQQIQNEYIKALRCALKKQ